MSSGGHHFKLELTIMFAVGPDEVREMHMVKEVELSLGTHMPKGAEAYVKDFLMLADGIASMSYEVFEIIEEDILEPIEDTSETPDEAVSGELEVEPEEGQEMETTSFDEEENEEEEVKPLYTVQAVIQEVSEKRTTPAKSHLTTGN